MLETFTLKQHLDTTRQELSQALYQHDAACRVIARLMKERDEARAALVNINSSTVSISNPVTNGHSHPEKTTSSSTQSMDVEVNSTPDINSGIDAVIIEKINDKCKELSSYRRTRKPLPEGILSKQSISSLKQISIFTPHKTDKVGVTALAISSSLEDSNGHFLLSGGADKAAILTDRISGTVVSRLTGHTKKVTGVAFHPTLGGRGPLFTSSADKTVKVNMKNLIIHNNCHLKIIFTSLQIWTSSEDKDKFTEASSTEHHTSDVTGIAVHPTGLFYKILFYIIFNMLTR
jgi:pre-mRNA-processing factor 19